jgi:hypothetical protein
MARHYFLHIALAVAIAIAVLVVIRLHSANGISPSAESAEHHTALSLR